MIKQISVKEFRWLIVAQGVVLVAGILSAFLIPYVAQEESVALYEKIMDLPYSNLEMVLAVILLPIFVWAVVNLFALYHFASYAPRHLLYITLLSTGLAFLYAPLSVSASFNLEGMFYYVGYMLSSITLALVYYSNIALEFTPKDTLVSVPQVGATEST